jgi:dTDP-4-dehydrorhamnose 3,5-epimerase
MSCAGLGFNLHGGLSVMAHISLEDFVDDTPKTTGVKPASKSSIIPQIEGVKLISLSLGKDDRGELNELLTTRDSDIEPIVHVYQVHCAPHSVRGWVYHKHQTDRLAYTIGAFRVVLYDLRRDSPSFGMLDVFDLGRNNRAVLFIPPFVVHGVQNLGDQEASFVNMPTRAYDPAAPDKSRVRIDHPGIPYRFN